MNPADISARTGAPSQDGAPVSIPVRRAPLRVVFDTNVLLSLFIFADSRFTPLLREVDAGRWLTYSNAACFGEFRRVLGYPMFDLSPERQATAAAAWQQRFIPVDAGAASSVDLPRCKDRDDQKFLELSCDAGADWLVTADKALLKLARRDKLRGLFRILTPEVALASLQTC